MRQRIALALGLFTVLFCAPAFAQDKLGTVTFPVSCTPAAQQELTRGLALYHSFFFIASVKAFTGAAAADPTCAMAQWGIAMAHWYPLWYPPTDAALKAGTTAVDTAKAIGGKTQRERDYIQTGDGPQALKEFETSLKNEPNRFNGIAGAARAAGLSGDRATARAYYAKLVALTERADTDRPEVREAKAFLAK